LTRSLEAAKVRSPVETGEVYMLEAIKKFVLQRSKDFHQRRRQVVEDADLASPVSDSEVAPQLAEPLLAQPQLAEPPLVQPPPAEPAASSVSGRVKWYNPDKRYGFVELSDGSGDAFLHATALASIGISILQPGETLELQIAQGERGPQVTQIISVDSSTAAPFKSPRKNLTPRADRQPLEASAQVMGTVKWYNAAKGFGFIVCDSGGKDIFIHASALERAGIAGLNEGQRVIVGVADGRKGPEAVSIDVAP